VTGRAAALAALIAAGCGGEPARPGAGELAQRQTVQRGDIVDRQVITGELRAASALPLNVPRAETWQMTIRWLAEDGAAVKAGDRVIEFDNSQFTAQLAEKHLTLLEAEMALRSARDLGAIAIAGKETELRQHQIALEKATARAAVPGDLLAGREAQERQLAKKRAEVAADKAEHELAAQRREAALELEVKQIELDKTRRAIATAEATIAALTVTAPRDGIVVLFEPPWMGRKVRVGDVFPPGFPVVTLPDMGLAMEVRAELSDVDDGRVAVGMIGTCTLDAYPGDGVPCTVKAIAPVARSKGESSLRRTFAVDLDFGKTDAARMRPGMSVKVELPSHRSATVLTVPRGAVIGIPGADRHAQVRMAGGELRGVTLGLCDGQRCAVEAGLAAGDVIVLGGGA
jgi:HlyD family secretion protein